MGVFVSSGLMFDVDRYFEGNLFKAKALFPIADLSPSSANHHMNMRCHLLRDDS
jgi:hypothetical protein